MLLPSMCLYIRVIIAFLLWSLLNSLTCSHHFFHDNQVVQRKIVNYGISTAHGIITALGATLALYLNPNIAKDLVFGESPLAVNLAVCSVGYFMYDLIDIIQITGFPPTKRIHMI